MQSAYKDIKDIASIRFNARTQRNNNNNNNKCSIVVAGQKVDAARLLLFYSAAGHPSTMANSMEWVVGYASYSSLI